MNKDETPRICRVQVRGLFDMYNHDLTLRSEGLTIIHGPNGVGKSTVLNLIQAAVGMAIETLFKTKFDEIEITYSGGQTLTVLRKSSTTTVEHQELTEGQSSVSNANFQPDHEVTAPITLVYEVHSGVDSKVQTFQFEDDKKLDVDSDDLKMWVRKTPWIDRMGTDLWRNLKTEQNMDWEDLRACYAANESDDPQVKQIRDLKRLIPITHVCHVESQRIVSSGKPEGRLRHRRASTRFRVDELAQQMEIKIANTRMRNWKEGQKLDQTFAKRVFEEKGDLGQADAAEIMQQYNDQVDFWRDLANTGIISPAVNTETTKRTRGKSHTIFPSSANLGDELVIPDKLDGKLLSVLQIYVNDQQQKQEPYRKLKEKAELFINIVNARFANKSIRCDSDKGFHVETPSGDNIPLHLLSSGEQHVVVLTYELIFGMPDNTLVMIDEPEISLHIDWQRAFIQGVQMVQEALGHEFIIATHSPQIVGDHSECMVTFNSSLE